MADLKLGTTIGGSRAWTQATLSLVPTGNTLLYKKYKIYTEFDKPTPGEINAYSKSETYSQQEVNDLGKLRILDIRNTDPTPTNFDECKLTTFFNLSATTGSLPIASQYYSGLTMKGWTNRYASWQLASYSDSGASDNKLWFRTSLSDTAWNPWCRVYTSSDKPTTNDINAVNRGGDTMTGPLTVPRINGPKANELLIESTGNSASPTLSVGGVVHKAINIQSESGVLNAFYNNTSYRIFHKGYLPTKVDVGLNNLMNWGYTDRSDVNNQDLYATAKAVDSARSLAFVYALIM